MPGMDGAPAWGGMPPVGLPPAPRGCCAKLLFTYCGALMDATPWPPVGDGGALEYRLSSASRSSAFGAGVPNGLSPNGLAALAAGAWPPAFGAGAFGALGAEKKSKAFEEPLDAGCCCAAYAEGGAPSMPTGAAGAGRLAGCCVVGDG